MFFLLPLMDCKSTEVLGGGRKRKKSALMAMVMENKFAVKGDILELEKGRS
jgi:hypothetical protein